MIQAQELRRDNLQKLIAQARTIAEFKPPADKDASPEQQQQLIEFLGLQQTKKNSQLV
jgi:hypothetical protein